MSTTKTKMIVCGVGVIAVMLLGNSFAHATIVDPSTVSGMRLRLDANAITGLNDGDPVSTWNDTSGNGFNAAQSTAGQKPTYKINQMNGKPVVRFDGSNDVLTNSANATGAQTWFLVYRQANTSGIQTIASLYDPSGATSYDEVALLTFGGYQNISLRMDYLSFGNSVGINPALDTSGHILAFNYNGAGNSTPSNYGITYDQTAQTTLVSSTFARNTGEGGTIGARPASNFLNGDLAEMIVYNGVLSASDYSGIQGYLYDKWFVTAVIPEPSTLVLLSISMLMLWQRRR